MPGSTITSLSLLCKGWLASLWVDVWFHSIGDSRVSFTISMLSLHGHEALALMEHDVT